MLSTISRKCSSLSRSCTSETFASTFVIHPSRPDVRNARSRWLTRVRDKASVRIRTLGSKINRKLRLHERQAWERHLLQVFCDMDPYTRGMVTLKLYSDFV